MTDFLFLTAWLHSNALQLTARARGHRLDDATERRDDDAGMTTLEILLWAGAAVVAVGIITVVIYNWLKGKANDVTQK